MSKIICDVCGTSYPDTATQCPICGNAKAGTAFTAANPEVPNEEGYAYVKGGRFSHANVRKMNNGQRELPRTSAPSRPAKETSASDVYGQEPVYQPEPQQPVYQEPVYQSQPTPREEAPLVTPRRRQNAQKKKKERTTNLILIAIVIVLVLAILSVCVYLVTRLLQMSNPTENPGPGTTTSTPKDPTVSTSSTVQQQIPCTGIRLSMPSYTFNKAGDKLLLEVTKQTANTTDPVMFESSDPRIARVDADGLIEAVADGNVTITVTCGEFTAMCEITCRVGVDPSNPPTTTQPGGPTTTKPTEPNITLELNKTDFTLDGRGAYHNLYSGELDPASITWTSSDPSIATVENGIVTAVADGTVTITAEYNGQKKTCIVRCNVPNEEVIFTLNAEDVMLAVGETFTLKAYDKDGKLIDPSELTFEIEAISADEGNFFTVDEKGVITAVKYNMDWKEKYKTLKVTYRGKTLTFLVYVINEW